MTSTKLSRSLVHEFATGGLASVFLVRKPMPKFHFGSSGTSSTVSNFENLMCSVMVYVECGEFVPPSKMVDNFRIIVS